MIVINNHLATMELIFHQGLLLASGSNGREGRGMKPCSEVWSSARGEQPSSNSSCPFLPHFLPKNLAEL